MLRVSGSANPVFGVCHQIEPHARAAFSSACAVGAVFPLREKTVTLCAMRILSPVPACCFLRPILGPVLCSLSWLIACLVLAGCAAAQPGVDPDRPGFPAATGHSPAQSLPEAWRHLGLRLAADNLYDTDLDAVLRKLDPPSPDPMGRKIQELYRNQFPSQPSPSPPGTPPPAKSPPVYVYPNVVTPENAAECRDFIARHETAFVRAEQRYLVPRSIAAALLFVETRLGRSLGKHNVLHTLASMAAARDPGQLGDWLEKLDRPEARLDWIGETMLKRSDWAYRELVAFLTYVRTNNIDPLTVPGSVYGAMGICQFMPSNISLFAVDGNDNGLIDLFEVDDAVASLSNYLIQNGWKPNADRETQFTALKRYNRLNIYANTILCLADLVRGEPVGQPVLPAGQKKPVKKPAGKKTPDRKTAAAKASPKKTPATGAPAAKTAKPRVPQAAGSKN